MLQDNINSVTISTIQELIADSVPEGRRIDYKQSLCGKSDSDKKEFLADVSSFANTQGGYLVFGISEANGIPRSISPLVLSDPDEQIRRMDSLIQSGIDPRIRYDIRYISVGSEYIFLINIARSWNIPHRVTFGGHDKFYARNSAGKYPLDVDELRNLFTLSMTINEKIEKRILERRVFINSLPLPIPSDMERRFSLHLIPLEIYRVRNYPDIFTIKDSRELYPISHVGWNTAINFEGFIKYSSENGRTFSYLQVHRDSMFEAVDAHIYAKENMLAANYFEDHLIKAVEKYITAYTQIGAQPPLIGFLSFYRTKGIKLAFDAGSPETSRPIDYENLYLPSFLIDDFSIPVGKVLKPTLDMLWNAFGYQEDQLIDLDGNWRGRL